MAKFRLATALEEETEVFTVKQEPSSPLGCCKCITTKVPMHIIASEYTHLDAHSPLFITQ